MIRCIILATMPFLAAWASCANGAVAVADPDRLWTTHQVPFAICETQFVEDVAEPITIGCGHGGRALAPAEAAKIREAVSQWNLLFGSELLFIEIEEMSRFTRGVLFSRPGRSTSCSTDKIGRPRVAKRTNVKIGSRCNRFAAAETPVGTILHEMMHVAGFYHEQQRPDRDSFVRAKVPDDLVSIWFDLDGATQWAKGSRRQAVALTPYDFGSIMHYPVVDSRRAVLTARGAQRLERQGLTMNDPGKRHGLSDDDIAGIRRLYQRLPAPRIADRRSLEPGRPAPL